jgi:hypothetical protein
MKFQGLCRALAYAHPDLDLDVDPFPYQSIQRGPTGMSSSHVAYGTIRYAAGPPGILIYFKSSLTGDEPPQVAERKREDLEFPHKRTSDQFFHETDFEAYRQLGHHIGKVVFANRAWQQKPTGLDPA